MDTHIIAVTHDERGQRTAHFACGHSEGLIWSDGPSQGIVGAQIDCLEDHPRTRPAAHFTDLRLRLEAIAWQN